MPCSTPPTGSSIRSIHALPQEPTFIWQRWESGGSSFRSGWLDHQRIHQPKICTYLFHVFFGVPLATIYAHIVLWRRYRKPRTSPGCTHTYVNMWYSQSWKMESQHWLWDTLGTCAVQSKTISMGVSWNGASFRGSSNGGFWWWLQDELLIPWVNSSKDNLSCAAVRDFMEYWGFHWL